jgi:hypothetical protein
MDARCGERRLQARKGRGGEGGKGSGHGGGTAKPPHRLAASGRRKAGRRFFGEFGWPVKGRHASNLLPNFVWCFLRPTRMSGVPYVHQKKGLEMIFFWASFTPHTYLIPFHTKQHISRHSHYTYISFHSHYTHTSLHSHYTSISHSIHTTHISHSIHTTHISHSIHIAHISHSIHTTHISHPRDYEICV